MNKDWSTFWLDFVNLVGVWLVFMLIIIVTASVCKTIKNNWKKDR